MIWTSPPPKKESSILEKLPREIMGQIIEMLGPQRFHFEAEERAERIKCYADLLNLSLVSKPMRPLVDRVLYQRIEITMKGSRPLLHRLLQDRELAKYVREAFFTFDFDFWSSIGQCTEDCGCEDDGEDCGCEDCWNNEPLPLPDNDPLSPDQRKLFGQVPCVRKFLADNPAMDIDKLFGGEFSHAVEAGIFLSFLPTLSHVAFLEHREDRCDDEEDDDEASCISRVVINSSFFQAVLQQSLTQNQPVPMGLLILESFVFKCVYVRVWDIECAPPKVLGPGLEQPTRAYTRGSSPITVLYLENADLHPQVLQNILALPRSLKRFTYMQRAGKRVRFKQNAHLLQRSLELQQKTLKSLTLLWSMRVWPNGGAISLERMKALKFLSVEVELLIYPPIPDPKRVLRDVLPESLENCQLDFCAWAVRTKKNAFQRISSQLQGIAKHPRDKFRALSKVAITVPDFRKDKQAEIRWRNGFVELWELFKVAEIDFEVATSPGGQRGLHNFYNWSEEVFDEQNGPDWIAPSPMMDE